MKRLLCLIGLHHWHFLPQTHRHGHNRRFCVRCCKYQYQVSARVWQPMAVDAPYPILNLK